MRKQLTIEFALEYGQRSDFDEPELLNSEDLRVEL
jgi:hypothetical protein